MVLEKFREVARQRMGEIVRKESKLSRLVEIHKNLVPLTNVFFIHPDPLQ
jgi:hypothetical protein